MLATQIWAQNDSIDILDYTLIVDIDNQQSHTIIGQADITLNLLQPCSEITFSLKPSTIDSIKINGSNTNYSYIYGTIAIPSIGLADTQVVSIYYRSSGYVENYGWGGFHISTFINFNLGVAFQEYPHNFGRSWFPCRDNFYDKSSYHVTLTCKPGWRALCSGLRKSETIHPDGSNTSTWELLQPTPTYLFSVSMANYHVIERTYHGIYGDYPAEIGFVNQDSAAVYAAFNILDSVVPMYERCFGPYRWDKIGYISTPQGSMEHVSNIAFIKHCMASLEESCQATLCHEFGHAWFGNLLTCSASQDMWINEGGASFATEVAFEGAYGKERANQYYNTELETVLRTIHHADDGHRPLHGVDPNHTYGNTTYNKGHMVWHSLRGYMGDSLFYACMRTLFDRHAFGNMDAYAIRDTLSAYSGINLDGFFDFHVFGAGYVDYVIDSLHTNGNNATLTLHQQLRGTDTYAQANRVPVTFFDDQLHQYKQWLSFDSISTTQSFTLPFEAAFAIIDFDQEISDAVTDNSILLAPGESTKLEQSHAYMINSSDNNTFVHIAHHWTDPQGVMPQGVTSVANRYWTVCCQGNATGRFQYSRGSLATSSAQYLDEEFYTETAQMDHMVLLYRKDATEPWHFASRTRRGPINEGYFEVKTLLPGQYTLALTDSTFHEGIQQPSTMRTFISPNPNKGSFEVSAPHPNCTLKLYSMAGAMVGEYHNIGRSIRTKGLIPGTYMAHLFDNNGKIIATQKVIILK